MRIVTAAVLFLAASAGAEASSILVIEDNREVRGNSLAAINDGRELSISPSVMMIGTPKPAAAPKTEASAAAPDPLAISPLPMVIRAGVEGEAFTRALAPDGTGAAQTQAKPRDASAPANGVSSPVAPRAAVDPAAPPPVARNVPAKPDAQPEQPAIKLE